jgi:hypothetical protein
MPVMAPEKTTERESRMTEEQTRERKLKLRRQAVHILWEELAAVNGKLSRLENARLGMIQLRNNLECELLRHIALACTDRHPREALL